jgi:hypothetical protein
MTEPDVLLCRRCGIAVARNRGSYQTFEHMHWLRFHLMFEHTLEGMELGRSQAATRAGAPRPF